MHPVCGHEYMLMGMAMDPEWILDMTQTFSDLTIKLQKILFEREGYPDGFWFYEDMGFKNKPFMSPAMYKDLIWPGHKKTFDYAHSIGCKVIVHSCGFVEPLVPGLIEAGMDCLQSLEIKAGMNLLKLKERYGHKIAFCGGLDIRVLETNDLDAVEELLQKHIPTVMEGSGYIIHSDHSIPMSVNYETYKFFLERARELGTY
jgi:uroporphyrinogen decarboxylase